jgi:hypothetical protein
VISELAYLKAQYIYDVLAQTMPNTLVNDVTVEYSQLKVKDKLVDMIREKSGKEGLDVLVSAIADLLNDFSHNSASYVRAILAAD